MLDSALLLAQSEGGGGSFLVQPDVGLMVWTLVVFMISGYLLRRYAFPRIAEALDRRQRVIEDSLETAAKTRAEAETLLEEYRERLAAARGQAESILARARKAADTAEQETLAEAKRRREELMAQTRRDIEAETRRAIQEIRNEVADLTILATEKVTRKTLTEDEQRTRVEETLAELDFSALAGDGGREQ
ncbi:MAG TPA: F0F1 ATP synthase subunit B [Solirubrobacteraceae bacterium]|nr:F0F1 ATP synthase subunit B [Solirubrobacteraceae bacterium]